MGIESTLDFVASLTTQQWIAYFWPFFMMDFIRYVLIDFVVLLLYIPRRHRAKQQYAKARQQLYLERPLVSVIVPGKNEGKHIPQLAESLTHQTYKNIEIVIIDDGSDDDSASICRRLRREGKIKLFIRNEVRGGKASAANTALAYARGKYIVHLDADSHLSYNAIETILLPFYMDEKIGAVGGDVRVRNVETSFATRLQTIEYIKSISTGRTVSSELKILRIIAGAHGAFRRDILERLHGWDVGPGLDGDITLKIRKLGFKVVHEPMAICYTNVPNQFRKLARQRFRWDRSMIRFRFRKHRDILLPSANFSVPNFIASAENLFFNLILDIKWWIYGIQIALVNPELLHHLVVINYVLYSMSNLLELGVAAYLLRGTLRKVDWKMFLYIPLMPAYTGFYLRTVRTYAYLMELFHGASYKDRWNPWKVSKQAEKDGL
ncbi:glycosyltransferase [Pseudomonadota bacterium]